MDYSNLRDIIVKYTERDDIIPNMQLYMTLLEANLNTEIGGISVMSETSTLVTRDQTNTLLGVGSVASVIDNYGLTLRRIYTPKYDYVSGQPQEYLINGKDTIELFPKPDGVYTYKVQHSSYLSPLLMGGTIQDTDTNWILTGHPDIYIYGILSVIYTMLNSAEGAKYQGLYMNAVKQFKKYHNRGAITIRGDTYATT